MFCPYSSAYVAETVSGGSLPGPARGDETAAGRDGNRAAEPEPTRLRAENEIRLALARPRSELLDGLRERIPVEQERRDVLEADARLGEVRDFADLAS